MPPEEVARRYQEAGYDFLAITDHFRPEYGFPLTDTRALRKPGFTTILGAELHAPRTEFSTKWHIIAVGLPLGFAPPGPGESGPELARRARAAGAFIGMAHPVASLLTLPDAESLDAAHAVEVYNALSAREDRGDSWHLCDVLLGRGPPAQRIRGRRCPFPTPRPAHGALFAGPQGAAHRVRPRRNAT